MIVRGFYYRNFSYPGLDIYVWEINEIKEGFTVRITWTLQSNHQIVLGPHIDRMIIPADEIEDWVIAPAPPELF